jgi:hypothetical protein
MKKGCGVSYAERYTPKPVSQCVGTSSNHLWNTPSVEGVGTSTLDDRSTHRQDQLNTRDKTRLNANTFLLLVLYYSINC